MDTIVPVQKEDTLYVIFKMFYWPLMNNFHNIRISQIAIKL